MCVYIYIYIYIYIFLLHEPTLQQFVYKLYYSAFLIAFIDKAHIFFSSVRKKESITLNPANKYLLLVAEFSCVNSLKTLIAKYKY
jgi:hypothetical protein